MSLELHDLGSVKISQRAHALYKAKAMALGVDVVSVIRQVIHEAAQKEFDAMSVAAEIYKSKGLGDILKDSR